ncbi:MAG TPA: GDSL-type esterase/lipase family protein [Chloroflexota bacterium]
MPHRSLIFVFIASALLFLSACGPTSPSGSSSAPAQPLPTEPSLAPPSPGSYAALGASETYGVGVVPRTDSYPYLVKHELGARRFVDVGIPGATLSSGYETELSRALDIRPSFCTVLFGTNDILGGVSRGTFLSDLYDLVVTLRQAHVQVLIIGLPDLSYFPRVQRAHIGGVHEIVTSWNSGMRSVARRTGAHFLDLAAYSRVLASHPEYITADGLHPGPKAHARLAQLILAQVHREQLWRTA